MLIRKHVQIVILGLLVLSVCRHVNAQQFARPDGTVSAGLWVVQAAATHHEAVDEVTANDDTDYIRDNGNNTTAELSLSDILDPQSSLGHIIRFRMMSGGSKSSEKCDIQLWQGISLIAATGTQNASRTAYGAFTYTLSGAQADAITNYADLRFKVITSSLNPADGDFLKVTWVELEVPTAAVTPPVLSTPSATAVTATTATLGATITSDGGAAVAGRGTLWNTTGDPVAENQLVEGGTATGAFSHLRSSLPAATLIYFRGYAVNAAGTGYSPSASFYTEPGTQASNVTFSNVQAKSMQVNWTSTSGDGVIVIMKQGSAVDAEPADGVEHAASASFGAGAQIGTGNYAVFRAVGSSVTVTNLTPGTTYHVAVHAYAGSGTGTSGINYLQSSPAAVSQATSPPTAPVLSSPTVSAAGQTQATLGATIDDDGAQSITFRGTVWNTTGTPVLENQLAEGGTALGAFSHTRSALPAASRIYFRGYAVNAVGTGYSPQSDFYTEPGIQASGVNFSNQTETGVQVNWTPGTGDGCIVVAKLSSAVDASPADGVQYTANAQFASGDQLGTGNYVIYQGSAGSVVMTGLASGNTYHLAVFAHKGSGTGPGGINYLQTGPATGSRMIIGPALVTTPTVSAPDATQATLGATVVNDGGDAVTSRGTVWGLSSNPAGNALSQGSGIGGFTHLRTGLPNGSRIYFRGYAVNGYGTSYSSDATFYTEPSIQASSVTFSNVTHGAMTVAWTAGNGDGVIVVMKKGAPVDAGPADGTEHTASNAFAAGEQLGTGSYVVYRGGSTSVKVIGLLAETTYHVAIHAFKGSGAGASGINYREEAPATASQATGISTGHNSSYVGDNCDQCHSLHSDLVPRNASQEVVCVACHNPSGQASGKSNVGLHSLGGVDCGGCHEVHNTGTVNYTDPHTGTSAPNISRMRGNARKYVPTAVEPLIYRSLPDLNKTSEAPGGGWYGACQTCHTTSTYHTNNNSGNHTHPQERGDYTGQACNVCHPHTKGFAPDVSNSACNDASCHGSVQGTRREPFGDFTLTSHHVAGGTVTEADCKVCHMEPDALHMDGNIDLRDPDAGTAITPFVTLSRNTASNVLETSVLNVQNNFCLKCHDGNGAASQATPFQPFSTGSIVPEVFGAFDPANPFHHAVRAPGDNPFCTPSTTNTNKITMVPPWNQTANSHDMISCFDCHMVNGHGSNNKRMLRGYNIDWDAIQAATSKSQLSGTTHGVPIENFCSICHKASVYLSASNPDAVGSVFEYHGAGLSNHTAGGASVMGCMGCHGGPVNFSGISDNDGVPGVIHGDTFVWPAGSNTPGVTVQQFMVGGFINSWQHADNRGTWTGYCNGGTCNHSGTFKTFTIPAGY